MIRVRLVRGPDQMPRRLWVRGHAGAGAAGQDVVCAAVSALVETLALALPKTPGWQGQIRVEEGAADFSFAEPISPEVRAVVEAIAAGLADLGTSHRRYVRYDDVEEPATAGRERGD